jgi:hypothetical protein
MSERGDRLTANAACQERCMLFDHLIGHSYPDPGSGNRLATPSPQDQRRYGAMGEHLICLAAKQEPRDAAPAMRRHDNQITPFVFSGGNDAFSRMPILQVNAIAGHSVCGPTLSSIIKNAISRRSRDALEATDRIRLTLPRLVSHVQGRPWLGHRDDGDLCIVSLGEGKPSSRAFVASSEPSGAIKICLYIDGPNRSSRVPSEIVDRSLDLNQDGARSDALAGQDRRRIAVRRSRAWICPCDMLPAKQGGRRHPGSTSRWRGSRSDFDGIRHR